MSTARDRVDAYCKTWLDERSPRAFIDRREGRPGEFFDLRLADLAELLNTHDALVSERDRVVRTHAALMQRVEGERDRALAKAGLTMLDVILPDE